MMRATPACLLAFALALVGCNAIFGLDEAELRTEAAGGGARSTKSAASVTSGLTTTSGSGGAPPHMCHEPDFKMGLVYDGSFEGSGWTFNQLAGDWDNSFTLCQDKYYIRAKGAGPPRANSALQG